MRFARFALVVVVLLLTAAQAQAADLARTYRGDDPDGLQEIYARVINYAIAERPADMTITTHVCRGNFRSTWISEGGYEPVAEVLFNELQVLSDYRLFLYSVVLIVCMLFFPNGLYGGLRAVASLLRRRTMPEGAPRSARAPGRPAG